MARHPHPSAKHAWHDDPQNQIATLFEGFHPLDANFIYCPNQFFDVCLPNYSRGTVRLVAYLLRRTLGWLDRNGNPIEQRISASYRDFIREAKISRGSLPLAIEEAVKGGFIRRLKRGRVGGRDGAAESGRFELRWDHSGERVTDPGHFSGFYAGEGNRSPIPNTFFDRVVKLEPLAVIQVVGAVLRHTVGYQNQFGGRRSQAPLSYNYLQRYTGIGGRRHLSQAIQHSLRTGYIRLEAQGSFDPCAGQNGEAAQYAVKWLDPEATPYGTGSKREPATHLRQRPTSVQKGNQRNGPRREPADRPKKGTSGGSKREPVERSRKGTKEKTHIKDIFQRQQHGAAAARSVQLLMNEGFDQATAKTISASTSLEAIRNQIAWLDQRSPSRNRLGMLRRAVLEDWPEPRSGIRSMQIPEGLAARFARTFYAGAANNPGEPVATPSHNDLAAAEVLVKRLSAISTDPGKYEAWGRTLGGTVRDSWGGKGRSASSLVAALRTHGDRFLVNLQAKHDGERAKNARVNKELERQTSEAEYMEYLRRMEVRIREERPGQYAAFEGWRESERERYSRSKIGAKHLLKWFDSEPARLEHFQSFFNREVPAFDVWRANPMG